MIEEVHDHENDITRVYISGSLYTQLIDPPRSLKEKPKEQLLHNLEEIFRYVEYDESNETFSTETMIIKFIFQKENALIVEFHRIGGFMDDDDENYTVLGFYDAIGAKPEYLAEDD